MTGYPALVNSLGSGITTNESGVWKIDTHMHLFDLNQFKYPWLQNVTRINRNFNLDDFDVATRNAGVRKMIFMESGAAPEYSLAEAEWVSRLASKDNRIQGIVAQLDLSADLKLSSDFRALEKIALVKGGRGKFQPQSPFFLDNLKHLADLGWTLDLLLSNDQLAEVISFISQAPDTRFILDHLGNPDYREGDLEKWRMGIRDLASLPNVNCKVSGIISRIGTDWSLQEIIPYFEHVYQSFGSDRLLFGGDWPVVLLAGSYQDWSDVFDQLTSKLTEPDRRKIFHENAMRIYNL